MVSSVLNETPMQWHRVTIDFDGPLAQETAETFRDYRLNVTFTHAETGETVTVPGFFAADGDAANSSASEGSVWRVHFAPPKTGDWTYTASFRSGTDVAVSLDPDAGTPVVGVDGDGGTFSVLPTDKSGDDLRGKGALTYDGDHYLTFAGSGENLIKSGLGGPENFLDYGDFDNTPIGRHEYNAHLADWSEGDPTWGNDLGKEIVGAINYLAEAGINSFYMMVNSVGGDARSVWPWAAENLNEIPRGPGGGSSGGTFNIPEEFQGAFSAFDVSKLDQWGILFEHMQKKGMVVHMILQERENDQLLNDGALGVERMLYLREMIARFGHNNGVIYNFGEENTNTYDSLQAMSDYIRVLDGYDRPIGYHILEGQQARKYGDLTPTGIFDVYSNHNWLNKARDSIERWYEESGDVGRPMPSYWDEQYNGGAGLRNDSDPAQQAQMRATLWGTLTVGGAGVEWYPGSADDTAWEDFSTRANAFQWTLAARVLFEKLPVDLMSNADTATTGTSGQDYVFSLPGEIYVIYLPSGGGATLDLSGAEGEFDVRWYNPRTGGEAVEGSISGVSAGGARELGAPPSDAGEDWVILVRSEGAYRMDGIDPDVSGGDNAPPVLSGPVLLDVLENTTAVASYNATDPDSGDLLTFSLAGDDAQFLQISQAGVLSFVGAPDYEAPSDLGADNAYEVTVTVDDGRGASDSESVIVTVLNDPVDDPTGGDLPFNIFLADADTDQVLTMLSDGMELSLADVAGKTLSIYAEVPGSSPLAGQIGSMTLDFQDGQIVRTESAAPYALFGDKAGDIFPGFALEEGVFSIEFSLFDEAKGRGTQLDTVAIDFSVTNGPVNQPPIPGADIASANEDMPLASIDVLGNDTDPDGNAPLVVSGASALNGLVTVAADSTLTYTPNADFFGLDTVTYTVSDVGGATASGTLSVTVAAVNDAPTVNDDSAAVEAGQAVSIAVLDNDSDVDPDLLTISEVGTPSGGTAVIQDGRILYTADGGFVGEDSFSYLVSDGTVSRSATVTVTVVAQNQPPVFASPAGFDVTENLTSVGVVSVDDPEDDTVTFAIAGGADAAAFAIDASSGTLTFAAAPNFEAPTDAGSDNIYDVTVSADDGFSVITQDISVTVLDDPSESLAPIAMYLVDTQTDEVVASLFDGAVVDIGDHASSLFSVYAEVPVGSVLAGQVGSIRLDFGDGQIVKTESVAPYALFGDSNGDFRGGTELVDTTYTMAFDIFSESRGRGSLLDEVDISFTIVNSGGVGPGNADPIFTGPVSFTVLESTTAVAMVTAEDDDGDALAYSISGGADQLLFAIDPDDGTLRFVSAPDFGAPVDADGDNLYEVTVSVSDGNGGSDEQALTVTVFEDAGEPDLPFEVFLVDADTDEIIFELSDGAALSADDLAARSVSVYVDVADNNPQAGDIGSVLLDFQNGQAVRTENVAPYSLFGDDSGDFFGGLDLGTDRYSFEIEAYSGRNGSGTLLETLSWQFDVV